MVTADDEDFIESLLNSGNDKYPQSEMNPALLVVDVEPPTFGGEIGQQFHQFRCAPELEKRESGKIVDIKKGGYVQGKIFLPKSSLFSDQPLFRTTWRLIPAEPNPDLNPLDLHPSLLHLIVKDRSDLISPKNCQLVFYHSPAMERFDASSDSFVDLETPEKVKVIVEGLGTTRFRLPNGEEVLGSDVTGAEKDGVLYIGCNPPTGAKCKVQTKESLQVTIIKGAQKGRALGQQNVKKILLERLHRIDFSDETNRQKLDSYIKKNRGDLEPGIDIEEMKSEMANDLEEYFRKGDDAEMQMVRLRVDMTQVDCEGFSNYDFEPYKSGVIRNIDKRVNDIHVKRLFQDKFCIENFKRVPIVVETYTAIGKNLSALLVKQDDNDIHFILSLEQQGKLYVLHWPRQDEEEENAISSGKYSLTLERSKPESKSQPLALEIFQHSTSERCYCDVTSVTILDEPCPRKQKVVKSNKNGCGKITVTRKRKNNDKNGASKLKKNEVDELGSCLMSPDTSSSSSSPSSLNDHSHSEFSQELLGQSNKTKEFNSDKENDELDDIQSVIEKYLKQDDLEQSSVIDPKLAIPPITTIDRRSYVTSNPQEREDIRKQTLEENLFFHQGMETDGCGKAVPFEMGISSTNRVIDISASPESYYRVESFVPSVIRTNPSCRVVNESGRQLREEGSFLKRAALVAAFAIFCVIVKYLNL